MVILILRQCKFKLINMRLLERSLEVDNSTMALHL